MTTGLYVHIPFCKKKCSYCDFSSYPGKEYLIPSYMQALYREMQSYSGVKTEAVAKLSILSLSGLTGQSRDTLPTKLDCPIKSGNDTKGRKLTSATDSIATIFIGGGTPSLLDADNIKKLFSNIKNIFDCSAVSEITFEANPESLSQDKLIALKESGVNRLSIGVQSFNNDELNLLGRIHNVPDFERVFTQAREIGFNNINIDLIYGLPGQSLGTWQKNLRQAMGWQVEHISIYPLTIEPETPFYKGSISVDDNEQADMYEWSIEYLSSQGYNHYEISNWSKPGRECIHNSNYWINSKSYIGAGVAAASYLNSKRWKNCADLDRYIKSAGFANDIIDEDEELTEAKLVSEGMILGLRRMEGVPLSKKIVLKYTDVINKLKSDNLIECHGQNMRLTTRGMLLANYVFREFVE